MTLQSSFDLDIFIKISTRTSQTIIDTRGLEEIFSLLQYSILALIASFLAITEMKISKMIDWAVEPLVWLEIGLFFSFSVTKGLWNELALIGI